MTPAGIVGHHLALDVDRDSQKTDDRPWSSYIPGPIKGLRSILAGDQRKVRSPEDSILIQTQPKAIDIDKEWPWETVELSNVNNYIIVIDYVGQSSHHSCRKTSW